MIQKRTALVKYNFHLQDIIVNQITRDINVNVKMTDWREHLADARRIVDKVIAERDYHVRELIKIGGIKWTKNLLGKLYWKE